MKIGGMGEVWLRTPSILFTVGAALVLFHHGRQADDPRLPWMYALFFLFNPVVAWHLHTVRPYALAGFLAAVSTVWFLRLLSLGPPAGRTRWLGYVLVNALGTLTVYWFFFLLAGQAASATLFSRGKVRSGVFLALLGSVIPFLVLWMPVLFDQLGGAQTSWMPSLGWAHAFLVPLDLLGGANPFRFQVPALLVYSLFGLALLLRFGPRPGLRPWRELKEGLVDGRAWLLLTIPVVAVLIPLLLSSWKPLYHPKYSIVASPGFALFLGYVLARHGSRHLAALACGFFLTASVLVRGPSLGLELKKDNRAVAQYLVDHYREGDELLYVSLGYAPTLHYLRALAPDRTFTQRVYPGEVIHHIGWRDQASLLQDTLALRREAKEVVTDLMGRSDSGRIWFLPDFELDRPLTEFLAGELRSSLIQDQVIPLEGWWVTEIQMYSLR